MIKYILLGFSIYACSMMGVIYYKYRKDKKNYPNLTFLTWLNMRITDLNTAILLKGAEMKHKQWEKALKKEQKKKKRWLEKLGFK